MKKYLVRRRDKGSLHLIGSTQTPRSPNYAEVFPAPTDAEAADDLDIVTEETKEMQNVQAKDAEGNLIFEEREIEYVDEETGDIVKETIKVPVWELDKDGNPVQVEVVVDTRRVVKINESKRQERLDAEAARQAEQDAKEAEQEKKRVAREKKRKDVEDSGKAFDWERASAADKWEFMKEFLQSQGALPLPEVAEDTEPVKKNK